MPRLDHRRAWQIPLYSMLLAGMLLLNTGCSAIAAVHATPASTPTLIPTAALTPSIPLTPTLTPSITPAVSQTPAGFYDNHKFGFSLVIPQGWSIPKDTGSQVVVTNDSYQMGFIGQIVDNNLSLYDCLDKAAKLFRDTSQGKLTSSTVGANDVLVLADGTKAMREGIQAKFTKGGHLTMQAVCAKSKTTTYAFFVFGKGTSMKDHVDVVDAIFRTLRLE
ncbi:MAG: hypothetical protein P4L50_06125 [Anaerolineaceae bacterium]|nr:hypothetical protein [Anaerolineaceae bacterium]